MDIQFVAGVGPEGALGSASSQIGRLGVDPGTVKIGSNGLLLSDDMVFYPWSSIASIRLEQGDSITGLLGSLA